MRILIHGDHHAKSRQTLQSYIAKAKYHGQTDVNFLDGRYCSLTEIIQSTESQSLFANTGRLTIIEHLFRRRSKTELKNITDFLNNLPPNTDIIIWEDRQLTPAQLKSLAPFSPQVFPLPKVIFKLTNAFTPAANLRQILNLLHQACEVDSAELVLIMLARQIRLYLTQPSRYSKSSFPPDQLITMHHQLAQIDIANKTGKLSLDLKSELANWLLKVYSK